MMMKIHDHDDHDHEDDDDHHHHRHDHRRRHRHHDNHNRVVGLVVCDATPLNQTSLGYSGSVEHRLIKQKNGPLITEIAILNLKRMSH